MKIRERILLLGTAAILSACAVFYEGFTRLDHPVDRPSYEEEYFSTLVLEEDREQVASIGDNLFTLERFTLSSAEVPMVPSHASLTPFPTAALWTGTHYRDLPSGERYIVYTTPRYYNGAIGVLLDNEGRLVTRRPIVQVSGVKAGRGWPAPSGVKFFGRKKTASEVWGLRYGGKHSGSYQFEVIDKVDPREIEVVQEILISPEEFRRGFVVKDVLVTQVDETNLGIISYTVSDLTTK